MNSETSNGPEQTGRRITYFLGLRSDPRTHAVLGHIRELKKDKSYATHTPFFETLSYGSLEELKAGAKAFVGNTDKEHLVYVCDTNTDSHTSQSATTEHGCMWKVMLGTRIVPGDASRCDRQLGAAKFLVGTFVKNIDEQLTKKQQPWGRRPMTLEEKRNARKGRQDKPIKLPVYQGRRGKRRYGCYT
jgi:hypothetical protein